MFESRLVKTVHSSRLAEDVVKRGETVAVLFDATWCPFCRSFRPIIERREAEFPVPLVNVLLDDYENPLWDRYSIEVVPALLVFRGGEVVFRIDAGLGIGLSEDAVDTLLEYFADDSPLRKRGGARTSR